jgi:hypothetical protein
MTGLDLDSFLRLVQADLSTWAVVGLATLGLALLVWSSWGSRRALRKCLILSLAAHVGLVLYGSTVPSALWALHPDRRVSSPKEHIRKIRVASLVDRSQPNAPRAAVPRQAQELAAAEKFKSDALRWDFVSADAQPADKMLRADRPKIGNRVPNAADFAQEFTKPAEVTAATPRRPQNAALLPEPEVRTAPNAAIDTSGSVPAVPVVSTLVEAAQPDQDVPAPGDEGGQNAPEQPARGGIVFGPDRRLRADRADSVIPSGSVTVPGNGVTRNRAGPPARGRTTAPAVPVTDSVSVPEKASHAPLPLALATPKTGSTLHGRGLAALGERARSQSLTDVPKLYQPRLAPNRSTQAQRIGASAASELAVERALDWLLRHQDDNGCWNAGIAHYDDGAPVKGDTSFTAHCPPGETCFGECVYWEADTALTGLALLTYLGAGYTQVEGRYAEVVEKGLKFLLDQQKPDGDLRGKSRVVGMYCHAMATLALCEAYALTGEDRLRTRVERAIAFMVRSRARDGMAWRYEPGAPTGDTSILGWIVMCLKSAKEVGVSVAGDSSVRAGALRWLDKVASGDKRGLARYQPWENVSPTMTAEAWVCRQFLGTGGPGAASTEAAEYLLRHDSDHGPTNMYYWYYATIALYQHGGEPWTKWNTALRDRLIGLQSTSGHQTGSWEPDSSLYGAKGGRIYSTALAALTLEVYYRYLRLYDAPKIPTPGAAATTPGASGVTTPGASAVPGY